MKKNSIALLYIFTLSTLFAYQFSSIISTENHTLFLTDDGKLYSCGENFYGQLGLGFTSNYEGFHEIKASATFVSIAVGENHSLALDSDGFIWGWGSNDCFQLSRIAEKDGGGKSNTITKPVRLADGNWEKIYACGDLSFGIKKDGSLWGWGKTSHFEMGRWNKPLNKIKHPYNRRWKDISLYDDYFVAEDEQGSLWTWGCVNRAESYSFFDFYAQNNSYFDVNKLDIENADNIHISKYNLSEMNGAITLYGYSVARSEKIYKGVAADFDDYAAFRLSGSPGMYGGRFPLNKKNFFYKKTEKKGKGSSVYSGYFVSQNYLLPEIIGWNKLSAARNVCYSLVKDEKKTILWTNGRRYVSKKHVIKNIWASAVIFLEDSDGTVFVIGYNENNRLGINKSEDEFLYYERLNFK